MWTRADLKAKAKEDLARSYWGLVLVTFIISLLVGGGGGGSSAGGSSGSSSSGSSGIGGGLSDEEFAIVAGIIGVVLLVVGVIVIFAVLFATFVTNPILVGAQRYYIEATYGQKTANDIGILFSMFKKGTYMNVVKVMFLKNLYTWLWSLLFIIPGIVKGYEYYMIPYILAENPELEAEEVFRLTKEMMDGNKFDTWVLGLSFIGWGILAVFTCGLLSIFYVNPYMYMTYAQLYETLKHRASTDYFDHTIAGNGFAYAGPGGQNVYGNPGAYAQANPYASPYADPYENPSAQSYATGDMFNPSAPIEEEVAEMADDSYKLPEDNE